MPSVPSSLGVEPLQKGSGRLLYHLYLPRGQVLLPAARRPPAVELAPALLLLRHVLPRVLLDRPPQFLLFHGDAQNRVDAPHLAPRIRPEFLVADQHLRSLVGIVGPPGALDAPPVHVRPVSYERVRPPVYLPGPPARPSFPALV